MPTCTLRWGALPSPRRGLRIAHELHDGQAQVLAYVNTKAQVVEELLRAARTEDAREQLAELASAAREVLADVREGILGLRVIVDAESNLTDALSRHIERWQDQCGIPVESEIDVVAYFTADIELQLLRIMQEALANVRKHSGAHRARVSVKAGDDGVRMTVEDDGAGFEPTSLGRSQVPRFGLATMRERADAIGAKLDIQSRPGDGTRIGARLPGHSPSRPTPNRPTRRPAMRVLIADDHALFRDSLKALLTARGLEVVGEAANGEEAVSLARGLVPDIVLMDLAMPEMDGLSATRLISAELPTVKVVVLTASNEDEDLFEAIKSGAEGYLLKDLEADSFFDLLEGVARGEPALTPLLARKLLTEFAKPKAAVRDDKDPDALTAREMEVLEVMVGGVTTNRSLAKHLSVSENTIKFHVRNILDKLHLHNRAEVVSHALRHGIVTPLDS